MAEVLDPPTHEEPKLPGNEHELDPKPEWQPRYAGSARLKDKVAIVTGGDSGIGRAVAPFKSRRDSCNLCVVVCSYKLEIAEKPYRRMWYSGLIHSSSSPCVTASHWQLRSPPTSTTTYPQR